ncbi:MAG: cytochrome C [Nitrospinae bacterium CG11_big_fil_rev_8_21_14_0_20_56_8]|nr:MAG: cytochrome C [Nitrospinae bacterium CG11_big_fil_rev_8_21_14_0_20_56_8]
MPQPTNDPYRLKPDDAMVVAKGASLYKQHCASCHGTDLAGEANWKTRKPDGRLPAPPHDESGHSWHHDNAALFNVTKYGPQYVAGAKYKSNMPAFEKTLSDPEIIAVLSYIKSTWPEDVRAAHDEINKRARQK